MRGVTYLLGYRFGLPLFQTVAAPRCRRLGSGPSIATGQCLGGRVHGWKYLGASGRGSAGNVQLRLRPGTLRSLSRRCRRRRRAIFDGRRTVDLYLGKGSRAGRARRMQRRNRTARAAGQPGPGVSRELWQGHGRGGRCVRGSRLMRGVDARKYHPSLNVPGVGGDAYPGHS